MVTADEIQDTLAYDRETGVFTWRVRPSRRTYAGDVAGTYDKEGYRVIKYRRRLYFAHRLAWLHVTGTWPAQQIDHINGQKDDNRISNLRDVSPSDNMCNIRGGHPPGRSGVLGAVKPVGKNKYRSVIRENQKSRTLGWFSTAQEANAAYLTAKKARDRAQGLEDSTCS